MFKKTGNKGITLISIVITIIILLILTITAISILTGENGLIEMTQKAKFDTDKATTIEQVNIAVRQSFKDNGALKIEKLKDNLSQIEGIEGVEAIEDLPGRIAINGIELVIDTDYTVKENDFLPLEYQEVEYIQSTGTQYIDTESIATINTKLYVKGCSTGAVIGSVNAAGAGISGNPFDITCFSSANKYGGRFGSKSTGGVIPYIQNEVHEFEISNGSFKCDEINYALQTVSTVASNKTISLFGITGNYGGNLKIYRSKIYENNVLEKDFIPCVRKSDSVAGMYDLVTNEFYTNSAGTGTFLVGNQV